MDEKTIKKIEAHVRLEGDLAEAVEARALKADRTIVAEIRRAIRVAYKMGAGDDRTA